jgi:uncharacterized protein YjbI with pentapeptide repeats
VARPISEPRVPHELTRVDLGTGGLHSELQLVDVLVEGRAEETSARSVEIHDARLDNVDLTAARLPHLELQDCMVAGGSLANVTARGGTAQRVHFERVRLTGLTWQEGTLRDVLFSGCRIDLASFAASRLERVRFEDCVLTQVDLQDARLAAVVFERCDLSDADLSGARLTAGCELHGCTLSAVRGLERLRGAAMPLDDVVASAPVFAAALGIRILQGDEEDGHR